MLQHLNSIIAHIKASHTWFDEVHGPAWKEPIEGKIIYGDNYDYKQTGIDDRFGNYAYIRHDGKITYSKVAPIETISGCVASIRKSLPATLVAVLYDADPEKLEECLINSLITWQGGNGAALTVTSGQILTQHAVLDEIDNLEDADAKEVLQKIDRYTVVSINFTLSSLQHAVSRQCPCNPCKTSC